MDFRFYIIDERTNEQFEIDEPIGFDGFKPRLQRDDKSHGMTFEVAEQELTFDSDSYQEIIDQYAQYGVDASLTLLIEINCGDEWQEFYRGMLDFATYTTETGDQCIAKLNVGQTGVQMVFKSRIETKVDLESPTSLDGSVMPVYGNLGFQLEIPSKSVLLTDKANMYEDDVHDDLANNPDTNTMKIPFGNIIYQEIDSFDVQPIVTFLGGSSTPQEAAIYTNMETGQCQSFQFDISGRISYSFSRWKRLIFTVVVSIIDLEGNVYGGTGGIIAQDTYDITVPDVDRYTVFSREVNFDKPNRQILGGYKIIARAIINGEFSVPFGQAGSDWANITFKTGTNIQIKTLSQCLPSDSKVFMLHESLSRIAESITDNKLTVQSDYYGRTDSNVNPTTEDGVASLRSLTNGLMLRNAELADNSDPKYTVSFKDIIEGLQAIDAIGYGIEGSKLRIEPWEYFYQDEVIFRCTDINNIVRKVDPAKCFSLINVGFAKWEAEEWNGIDGFHGKRQFRTNLKNVDSKFEQFCKLVADSYAIEATRRRGISDPSKDWRYDNDSFIFDLYRSGGDFAVNTGDGDPNTLIDPDTVFNVELSPERIAARWFSWVMQGVKPTQGDELIFTGAEGYAGAKTTSTKEHPTIAGEIAENENLSLNKITKPSTPKLKPETVEFEYPLTFYEFAMIKQNPYGLIEFDGEYGYIKEIEADIINGLAKFTLTPKL